MNKPSIDEILAPKPEARPRIYAYAIADAAHAGRLKAEQTTRDDSSTKMITDLVPPKKNSGLYDPHNADYALILMKTHSLTRVKSSHFRPDMGMNGIAPKQRLTMAV